MVYVLDIDGTPLMPTKRYGKVRRMLNNGEAVVFSNTPFTIQLTYRPKTDYIQEVIVGVDGHNDAIGISGLYRKTNSRGFKEIYSAEIHPRRDVSANIKEARMLRGSRRRRNDKRKSNKKIKGQKSNKKVRRPVSSRVFGQELYMSIYRALRILPVFKLNFEVSEIPMIKHRENYISDGIHGRMFNRLKLYGRRNYVINRDHHTCQWCYGKSHDNILVTKRVNDLSEMHPDIAEMVYHDDSTEVVTLCKKCLNKFNKIEDDYFKNRENKTAKNKYKRVQKYILSNHERFLNKRPIMYSKIKHSVFSLLDSNPDYVINGYYKRYGVDTSIIRHEKNIEFSPVNNARIVAIGWEGLEPMKEMYYMKYRKHHDRSLHKITPKKGGIRPSRTPKILYGFKSYDYVEYVGTKYPEYTGKKFFITKRRRSGYFAIGNSDGTTLINSVKYNLLRLVRKAKTYSFEIINNPNEYAEK